MPDGFDVFLSHNSRDKPIVEEIGARLRGEGLRVWLDKWELRPGFPWQEGLEEGLQASRAVAVFVGKDGLGAWQEPEMRAFIARSRREKVPVIPVLLPGCPDSPRLTLFLEAFTWVDLSDGLTEDGLARLLWGITGTKPPAGPVPTTRRPKTWWRWGAGLSLLVVLAVAAWLWLRPPEPGPLPTPPKPESTAVRSGDERRQEPERPAPQQGGTSRAAPQAPASLPTKPVLYAVRVQVFDPQGQPVEGATIRASVGNEPHRLPDGWWQIDIPAVKVPADGRISLRADHKDWKGNQVELILAADSNPQVKIHLNEPETWVRGQVVDQSGRGVSGAKVFRQGGPSEVAIANEEGHFELRLTVPSGERVRLRAELGEQVAGVNFCLADSDCSITVVEER
jgi:hypothetical protein